MRFNKTQRSRTLMQNRAHCIKCSRSWHCRITCMFIGVNTSMIMSKGAIILHMQVTWYDAMRQGKAAFWLYRWDSDACWAPRKLLDGLHAQQGRWFPLEYVTWPSKRFQKTLHGLMHCHAMKIRVILLMTDEYWKKNRMAGQGTRVLTAGL